MRYSMCMCMCMCVCMRTHGHVHVKEIVIVVCVTKEEVCYFASCAMCEHDQQGGLRLSGLHGFSVQERVGVRCALLASASLFTLPYLVSCVSNCLVVWS